MSLFKLLATGKSLIGMKDKASPYRMRTANLLPKFDSPKNPFAQPKTESPKTESAGGPKAASAAKQPAKAETRPMETNSLFEAPKKPAMVVGPVQEIKPAQPRAADIKFEHKTAKPEIAVPMVKMIAAPVAQVPRPKPVARPMPLSTKPSVLAEWAKKINPLSYLPVREPGAKGAKSRAGRPAVQTELSLENVKVVRNDLSDSDLEVIRTRPAGKPEATETRSQPVSRLEPTTLNRLTSLLGAGQPQV